MLYNIYHSYRSPLSKDTFDVGISLAQVEKMAEAFLRDEKEIKFEGRTYSIGETAFQIYEVPFNLGGDLIEIRNYFYGLLGGNAGEGAFEDCKNITKDFLKGRERGALKDELYNVYINVNGDKKVRTTVEKDELLRFIDSWQLGEPKGWLEGSELVFIKPLAFKIYDIKFEYRFGEKGETKKYLNNQTRLLFRGWTTAALEQFGKDITSQFKIGPYGSKKRIDSTNPKANQELTTNKNGKIFISHSSKDKDIVTEFTNEILILCLGAENSKIFCTSIEGLGITSGQDFRLRIKNELEQAQIVIQIISKDYKASEVCLNEMGAAWVLAERVIPLVIDGGYDVGFIHSTTHQLNLNKKSDILHFIDDLEDLFPAKAKRAKMEGHVEKFLKMLLEFQSR